MKKKHKYMAWGLVLVPFLGLIDTIVFKARDFPAYVAVCLFEYLIFFAGVHAGEKLKEDE